MFSVAVSQSQNKFVLALETKGMKHLIVLSCGHLVLKSLTSVWQMGGNSENIISYYPCFIYHLRLNLIVQLK